MEQCFSQEFKNLFASARQIAMELGYDYISTIHLILADCQSNEKGSIRNFIFQSEEEYRQFFAQQKAGEPFILAESIRLTKETEKAFRKAFKLWSHSHYIDTQVRPYHLFLAASLLHDTLFYAMLEPKKGLHGRLEKFYLECGELSSDKINKPLWVRLSHKLFS